MQPERHKTKEDTWKTEELKKHLKPMQSESSNEKRHKESRRHREEEQDEHVERRHKSDRKERDKRDYESTRHAEKEKRERDGYAESDKRANKERGERRNYSESDGQAEKDKRERSGYPDGDRHAEKERREKRSHTESDTHAEKERREKRGHTESDRHAEKERREKHDHTERDRRDEKERRERSGYPEGDRHAEKERREKRGYPEGDRHAEKERREKRGYPESDRHADKERGQRRSHHESDRHAEKNRREKQGYPEIGQHAEKDRRERSGYPESDRHVGKERDHVREHHREKEKAEKDNTTKDYGTSDLSREERKIRESLEKSKHRSDDRERRHQEKRDKEKRKQETEEHKDGDKRREDLGGQDTDKERRRRSDQKLIGESDREKRHHSRREKGLKEDTEVRPAEISVQNTDKRKEKQSKEHSQRENKEGRHRDKRGQEAPEGKNVDIEEIEETIQSTDNAYEDSINYEEDFEDYDDDFEDASEEEKEGTPEPVQELPPAQRNKEIEEIQTAMLLENENVSPVTRRHKSQGHYSHEPEAQEPDHSSRKSHRGVFIDFGSAKQRQVSSQVASKQKKRSLEILKLIDLDFSSTFSLLDLAPVNEYEMYIRNFGKTNTKQAYVQCNDDAVDREIQTEDIDIEEKWSQHPAEGAVVCGGQKNDSEDMGLTTRVDSQRLTDFLHSASQVMAVLLEENRLEYQSQSKVQSKEPCMSISEGCFHLNTNLPFLQGRQVYQLQFSETQRHLLLTVHSLNNTSGSTALREKCLICVWNIWQPFTPQNILMCDSEVECCCFSPGKACLVFAGTVNGSVLVWDLREDFSMHHTIHIEDSKWTFRSVTFSTDGVYIPVNHKHPIKAIEPVPSGEAKDHGISQLSSHEEISDLSFQLASLDESGHLIFWVVVELWKADLAGSQSDLGLIPSGKVKLIHSSSVDLHEKFFHKDILTLGTPETLNIKFLPHDSNHFIIGTDLGIVSHGTRYGVIEPPIQYTSLNNKLRPSKVTATDFSPFGVPAFLAGCSDGCIRLHTISAEYPVMQWNDTTSGQAITALQWSLTRPTMFFVLDAASSIYVWDLLQNDLQPVAKESITSDLVLSMSVFGEPEKNNHLMGLALAKASGKVEIQYIKKKWTKTQPNELEKLQLIMQEVL